MHWFFLFVFCVRISVSYDWCPQYHLIRDANVYDPSGPIYYNGLWHVFEDHCQWCHWYSTDLLHWKPLNPTGFTGLTGSVTTINDDQFIAFYPSGDQTAIVRAVSNDVMLANWTITGNIIKRPDDVTNKGKNFRDPLRPLTKNGETYIGVGSGVAPNGPGMVLWYKAIDYNLTEFNLVGSLFNVTKTNGCIDSNTIIYNPDAPMSINAIECPDIFLMEDKYVLILGLFCTNEYYVGNFDADNKHFVPLSSSNTALLDYGNFYAAKTGTYADGVNGEDRRILFGFTGWSEPTAPKQCGRSHVIPRDITLNNNNMLNFNPIAEISSIRGNNNNIQNGSELQIMFSCEMISSDIPSNGNLSVNILISSDNTEYVQIGYSFEKGGYFYVDHRKCCKDNNNIVQYVAFGTDQIINENGININILLDRSIIESFLNQQKVITSMVSPSNSTAPQDRGIDFNNNFKQYFSCYSQAWKLAL